MPRDFTGLGKDGLQSSGNPFYLASARHAALANTMELTVTNTTGAHHPFHLHGFSFQPKSLTSSIGGGSYSFPYHEFQDIVDVPAFYYPHVPGLLGRSADDEQVCRGRARSVAVPLSHPSSCHVRDDVGASRPQEVEFMETKVLCEQQLFTQGKTVKEGVMNMRQLLLAIFSMLVGWGTAGVAQAATDHHIRGWRQTGKLFYLFEHCQLEITRVCAAT